MGLLEEEFSMSVLPKTITVEAWRGFSSTLTTSLSGLSSTEDSLDLSTDDVIAGGLGLKSNWSNNGFG